MTASRRPSILESPWYWVYAFATAGLIGLMLIGPKFVERQVRQERNFQGRQRAVQQAAGGAPDAQLSTADDQISTLTPLYILLGLVLLVSWTVVWWRSFGHRWRSPEPRAQAPTSPLTRGT